MGVDRQHQYEDEPHAILSKSLGFMKSQFYISISSCNQFYSKAAPTKLVATAQVRLSQLSANGRDSVAVPAKTTTPSLTTANIICPSGIVR